MASEVNQKAEQEKLKFIAMFSLTALIFFSYVGLNSILDIWENAPGAEQEVFGVDTEIGSEPNGLTHDKVKALADNSKYGKATIQLDLSRDMRISDVRLQFDIVGDLEILEIKCTSDLICIQSYEEDDSVGVYATGLQDGNPQLYSGRVDVIEIYYDVQTYGELLLNDGELKSGVTVYGSDDNLLDEDPVYLAVGHPKL